MGRDDIIKAEDLSSGLHPSLPLDTRPLWADGLNVNFSEKSVQLFPGAQQLFVKIDNQPILGMFVIQIQGVNFLYYGTATALFQYDDKTNTVVDVTRLSGAYTGILDATDTQPCSRWSFSHFGITVYANNGVDAMQKIRVDIDTEFEDFTDPPFTSAELTHTLGQFLMGINTNIDQEEIVWSDESDPTQWSPAGSSLAGTLPIEELGGPAIAKAELLNGLGVYGSNTLHLVSFLGPPFVFGALKILEGIGAVSKHAIQVVGNTHYGMGPRGLFITDGSQFQYIDEPSIHDFVYDPDTGLNRQQQTKVASLHLASFTTVIWWYPAGASRDWNGAVAFNYVAKTWTILGFFRSAGEGNDLFGFPLSGDTAGTVFAEGIEGGTSPLSTNPLTLQASTEFFMGFGQSHGQGGFGGTWTVVG